MKIISKLPDRKYFANEKITDNWWIFKDKETSLRIYSKLPDPFCSDENCILFSIQNKKSDGSLYPYNLILKVFPVDEGNINEKREVLCREKYKSQLPHVLGPTTLSFHFPTIDPNLWVSYFTYPHNLKYHP